MSDNRKSKLNKTKIESKEEIDGKIKMINIFLFRKKKLNFTKKQNQYS